MIILVEGPDLSGKTTLVGKLAAEVTTRGYEVDIQHHGPLVGDPLIEYTRPLLNVESHRCVIGDRWHTGELVYGPLIRGGSAFTNASWRHCELLIASRGALVVMLQPTPELLSERYALRGDDLLDEGQVIEAGHRYDIIIDKLSSTAAAATLVCDAENIAEPAVFVDAATHLHKDVERLRAHPGYIGPPNPSCLIIGPTTDWMLESLPADAWRDVGIISSESGPINSLWDAVDQPPIVTLGAAADKAVKLPHARVPDPDYLKAFRPELQTKYGESIIEFAQRQEHD